MRLDATTLVALPLFVIGVLWFAYEALVGHVPLWFVPFLLALVAAVVGRILEARRRELEVLHD